MSGHSKWATIRHKKGANDAKRGKLFTKIIREITMAARLKGGDLNGNPRLRRAISNAKDQQMPADTIQRAIKRGTGEIEGAVYEEVFYEGTGPSGTLFLVEGTTDNRNRTVAEIRKIFEKHHGSLGGVGTAVWAFERKGTIALEKGTIPENHLMDLVVQANGDDYEDGGSEWHILTRPDWLNKVVEALEDMRIAVKNSSVAYFPKNRKLLKERDAELAIALIELLEDHDDVQHVFSDFDIDDEEVHRMTS
ncbi:YebC/PmpR family DNA-binding transcriptional regulator [Pajaroellobacter abortibovis]|uniref:Probable transcriptional regulatory protein BCY86_06000 n=1 Tax=Pajaroellobacter abortibovis TaxID=1882918 RepID=A0A1L6MY09_9BACT|nr:YebC/PmpR family DNA-binding transcriptional regulator [Pajaroellobacter abortibovis]APS00285.1 transcriptional regulator [Pajaroellobacter abortibovis]